MPATRGGPFNDSFPQNMPNHPLVFIVLYLPTMYYLGNSLVGRSLFRDDKVGRAPPHRSMKFALVAIVAISLLFSGALEAKTPEVRVKPEGELAFGTFMVFGSGARTVSASGLVSDFSIVPLEGTRARPARFTIEFDRGNESKQVMDVTVQLAFFAPSTYRQGGVEARLSAFETDLAGNSNISSGELIELRFENCRTRICSKSFHIGARLDVNRQFGGADLVIPIDISARILTAERQ